MPYDVGTDHRVVAFGANKMILFGAGRGDEGGGNEIATATRESEGAKWVVHVDLPGSTTKDVEADGRSEAITALIELSLEALPGQGYSIQVPRELKTMP